MQSAHDQHGIFRCRQQRGQIGYCGERLQGLGSCFPWKRPYYSPAVGSESFQTLSARTPSIAGLEPATDGLMAGAFRGIAVGQPAR